MFRVKTKIMETRPADVARDAWRGIQRDAMVHVAQHWHKEMLPDHFNVASKHKYNHERRSTEYRKTKVKLAVRGKAIMGGVVDNVLTGQSMRDLMTRSVIRGFPTRATLYMFVPSYFNIKFNRGTVKRDGSRNKPSRQPNKPNEVTSKTANELAELRKVIKAYVVKRLQQHRGRSKTTTV